MSQLWLGVDDWEILLHQACLHEKQPENRKGNFYHDLSWYITIHYDMQQYIWERYFTIYYMQNLLFYTDHSIWPICKYHMNSARSQQVYNRRLAVPGGKQFLDSDKLDAYLLLAPWPSPRALLVGWEHCQLVEFCESQGNFFWLPWQQSGYHGKRGPCQQFLSHSMPLL